MLCISFIFYTKTFRSDKWMQAIPPVDHGFPASRTMQLRRTPLSLRVLSSYFSSQRYEKLFDTFNVICLLRIRSAPSYLARYPTNCHAKSILSACEWYCTAVSWGTRWYTLPTRHRNQSRFSLYRANSLAATTAPATLSLSQTLFPLPRKLCSNVRS